MLGQGSLQIVSIKFLILPLAFKLFSLVVGVTAAYVHHITRSHVDARLKQAYKSLLYDNMTGCIAYNQWNSEHLHGGGVVQDLIDHHPLQVAVHLGQEG